MFEEDNENSIFADLIKDYQETSRKLTSALSEELFLDIRPLLYAYEK